MNILTQCLLISQSDWPICRCRWVHTTLLASMSRAVRFHDSWHQEMTMTDQDKHIMYFSSLCHENVFFTTICVHPWSVTKFCAKIYFPNVNGSFGRVSLLSNETLAVMLWNWPRLWRHTSKFYSRALQVFRFSVRAEIFISLSRNLEEL